MNEDNYVNGFRAAIAPRESTLTFNELIDMLQSAPEPFDVWTLEHVTRGNCLKLPAGSWGCAHWLVNTTDFWEHLAPTVFEAGIAAYAPGMIRLTLEDRQK